MGHPMMEGGPLQPTQALDLAQTALRQALDQASKGLVGRRALVEMILLCAVAGEHLLVIGPPGTAKSEAVRRVSKTLSGNYFEYLLGRFTEPSEIFGPVDLRRLREGELETLTQGMLPEAEIAFLDEVFLGSTAILNTLLTLLNERRFRRGHTLVSCPLRICVGASNALPAGHALEAFADRFLVQVFVEPVADSSLEDLLALGWASEEAPPQACARMEHLDLLGRAARKADMSKVRGRLAEVVRVLRGEGIVLSDRRVVKAQKLIAAAATLAGRAVPTQADLWPILYAIPGQKAQEGAAGYLREFLKESQNGTLMVAALEASQGPRARADSLCRVVNALLASRPDDVASEAHRAWCLKLEGAAREIDAGFAREALPEDLAKARALVVAALAVDVG